MRRMRSLALFFIAVITIALGNTGIVVAQPQFEFIAEDVTIEYNWNGNGSGLVPLFIHQSTDGAVTNLVFEPLGSPPVGNYVNASGADFPGVGVGGILTLQMIPQNEIPFIRSTTGSSEGLHLRRPSLIVPKRIPLLPGRVAPSLVAPDR